MLLVLVLWLLLLGNLLGLLARGLWGTMAARGGRTTRELLRGTHRLACAWTLWRACDIM